ncbi:MAG: hypothetical protein M0036_17525 [Desulfobacteraceae bacterium]|nr:hypothetical protein [Desulfobacteraceae bacterium]
MGIPLLGVLLRYGAGATSCFFRRQYSQLNALGQKFEMVILIDIIYKGAEAPETNIQRLISVLFSGLCG